MSPEVDAAQAKLDTIPEVLVSAELRAAVLEQARGATIRREAAELLATATERLQTALAAGQVAEAVAEAGHMLAVEALQPQLPSAELPAGIIAAALDAAARVVDGAEPAPLPVTDYSLELSAYRDLPPRWQSTIEPPVMLPADMEARKAIEGLSAPLRAVTSTIDAWRTNSTPPITTNPLDLLAAVGGIDALAGQYTVDLAAATEIVAEANRARAAAEFTWTPPTGIAPAVPELSIRSLS